MNTIDLTPYQVVRYEKTRWRFPSTGGDVLATIKSKGLRDFLKNIDQVLATQNIISTYKKISRDEFAEWLSYYQTKMAEHQFDFIASLDWYDQKIKEGKTVEAVFFHQQNKMVASGIFLREGNHKATLAFKASDRLELTNKSNSSIGAVVDYFFLKTMREQHVEIISSGRSRNAFGVINTLGYLDYKLRFGYEPTPAKKSTLLYSVPVNEKGIILFFGIHSEKVALYALKPKDLQITFEQSRFASQELPFIELTY